MGYRELETQLAPSFFFINFKTKQNKMKLNQKQKVLRHLNEYGTITPLEAFKDYGIMRLAAVIFNLKDDGYDILSDMTSSLNRFGEKVNFSKYTLQWDKYNRK